ncbi:MAG: hypothetical protein HY986_24075 [Candidatus Melainabacteria bacterium]|nr:hypothetical protein [Candidatus Melainabacteria bacterium]
MSDLSRNPALIDQFCLAIETQANVLRAYALEDEEITPPDEFVIRAAQSFVRGLLEQNILIGPPGFHIADDGLVSLAWTKGEDCRLDAILFLDTSDDTVTVRMVFSRKSVIESDSLAFKRVVSQVETATDSGGQMVLAQKFMQALAA